MSQAANEHEGPLQADDAASLSHDSVLAASLESGSYLTSINSSVLNYKYENGRRYHAFREGAYLVPNDDEEQDRMDLGHYIYRLLLGGGLFLAPIGDKVTRVLDLGTGTGIWAMDFADEYPQAEVLGTDLSPIQPPWYSSPPPHHSSNIPRTPPNCLFEVDDFESDWLFRQPFDFIHARELQGSISDNAQFFRRALQSLAPGGYLEMQAVHSEFKSDDNTKDKAENALLWMKTMVEGSSKFGKPLNVAPEWKREMEDAGFVDVEQKILKVPIGSWPKDPKLKDIGKFQSVQEAQVITSYTPGIFSRILGWSDEEIQVFVAKVKRDLSDPSIHLYLPVYLIWGRKPE
ncbi:TAM domain protein [Fusarium sp. NRRL 52700]|nr:TAM domain protein [Fusarium sp. NRRL 52700]